MQSDYQIFLNKIADSYQDLHSLLNDMELSQLRAEFYRAGWSNTKKQFKFEKPPDQIKTVLGISCHFHNSAAAIVINGRTIAAVEEERLSRIKNDSSFPRKAISYCLKAADIKITDIDVVVFYEDLCQKMDRMLSAILASWPCSEKIFELYINNNFFNLLELPQQLSQIGYNGPIDYLEHHVSHGAGSFYTSPFSSATIVTVDGVGEWAVTSISAADNNKFTPLINLTYPHSIGLFYSAITSFLGFSVNEGEYKVMGLASYGKPTFKDKLKEIVSISDDAVLELDMDFFCFERNSDSMYTNKLKKLLGPDRITPPPYGATRLLSGSGLTKNHINIASSAQAILEEYIQKLLFKAYDTQPSANLCMTGGVALNGRAVYKAFKSSPFKNIFIPPGAGDAGCAVGAALFRYWHDRQQPQNTLKTTPSFTAARHQVEYVENESSLADFSPYLGPEYSDDEIISVLNRYNLIARKFTKSELIAETVRLIGNDKIVGWFQGRVEFGPRALGNRSILANPCSKNITNRINKLIKMRESFRPFAPAVMEDYAAQYFTINKSPYMLFVCDVKKEQQDKIPAVTHIDKTARPQTVTRSSNPLLYRLLNELSGEYGIPVVLNTSFNVNGEPIVCSPEDAVKTFLYARLDYLVIGSFIIERIF